jgi:serine/threonine protein phosphatase PrpC
VHETDPDLFKVELAPGDRLLLCSDGASGSAPTTDSPTS